MKPKKTVLALLLILATVIIRISQFIPNVAPVAALALFSGAALTFPWSVIVPLVAMLLADSIIGFGAWPITFAVYGSFAITILLGMTLRGSWKPLRLAGATIINSLLFYLITNAAVWWFSGMYAQTLDGLLLSYYFALPFLRLTLFGDMLYVFGLFLSLQYLPVLYYKACRLPLISSNLKKLRPVLPPRPPSSLA